MAPPRKHATNDILDAARSIALRDGPRATSVAAIAQLSSAPAGTLYHRFGSRDRLLQAAWLRALGRFQAAALGAADEPDPVEAGVAMAVAAVAFARRWPDDARLIVAVRRRDLLDRGPDADFEQRLAALNRPLGAAIARIAEALGLIDAPARELVVNAVVDVPQAAVRRHGGDDGALPPWLEASVALTARRLLTTSPGEVSGRPPPSGSRDEPQTPATSPHPTA